MPLDKKILSDAIGYIYADSSNKATPISNWSDLMVVAQRQMRSMHASLSQAVKGVEPSAIQDTLNALVEAHDPATRAALLNDFYEEARFLVQPVAQVRKALAEHEAIRAVAYGAAFFSRLEKEQPGASDAFPDADHSKTGRDLLMKRCREAATVGQYVATVVKALDDIFENASDAARKTEIKTAVTGIRRQLGGTIHQDNVADMVSDVVKGLIGEHLVDARAQNILRFIFGPRLAVSRKPGEPGF